MRSFERWTKSLPIGHSFARDRGPQKSIAGSATDSDATKVAFYIYNFIHHQTMIANSEKTKKIEIIKN